MMNFKDFQKTAEDKDTVTMTHKSGHSMRIMKNKLPKIQQEALKRIKFKDGGEVAPTTTDQSTDSLPSPMPTPSPDHSTTITINAAPTPPLTSATPSPVATPTSIDATPVNTGATTPVNTGAATTAPNTDAPQPVVSGPTGTAAAAQSNLNAIGQGETALKEQQAIDTQKAQSQSQFEQDYLKQRQAAADQDAQALKDVSQHTDDFKDYINQNPIDAQRFQRNMPNGQKVANAIGLFLGGAGVPFGGHNYAADFLQKNIDRDIQAQKDNVDNQKSVYNAYQALYGDSNISTNLAKVSANDMLDHHAKQIAASLGTQQAAANYNALSSKLQLDNANLKMEAAAILGNNYRNGKFNPEGAKQSAPQAGQPGQPGNAQKADWYEDHILAPNSDDVAKNLYLNPQAKPNLQAIQEQKAKADLADKALATINDKFSKLVTTRGSASSGGLGYAHRKADTLSGLPFVGGFGKDLLKTFTDTNENRSYDSDYSAVVGAVRGALQGNVSEDLLDSTIRANTPEQNDTPELLQKKLDNLKEFIKSHTKTDLLRPYGLSKY